MWTVRLLVVAMCALCAAGCAETTVGTALDPGSRLDVSDARVETPGTPLECVPYARARSGVQLFGDAGSWWTLARGRYSRSRTPAPGSVLVLTGYAGPGRGHLAVVSRVVSPREIKLDHANWLGDGAIYLADPAVDVSPDNDWTELRVWNTRAHSWGTRTYLVAGFVGPARVPRENRVAAR